MSVLFPSDGLDMGVATLAADVLHVHDVPYSNAAAKFWTALISEALCRFPDLSQIELTATTDLHLHLRFLFPGVITRSDLGDDPMADSGSSMADTIAAMELFGPPPVVNVRALSGYRILHEGCIPDDCLDCDSFPYLLVWLLDWGGIPIQQWNDPHVAGFVRGDDRKRRRRYAISFEISRRHLSEGLYRLIVRLFPKLGSPPQ